MAGRDYAQDRGKNYIYFFINFDTRFQNDVKLNDAIEILLIFRNN